MSGETLNRRGAEAQRRAGYVPWQILWLAAFKYCLHNGGHHFGVSTFKRFGGSTS
jgi:hypothetical protein